MFLEWSMNNSRHCMHKHEDVNTTQEIITDLAHQMQDFIFMWVVLGVRGEITIIPMELISTNIIRGGIMALTPTATRGRNK